MLPPSDPAYPIFMDLWGRGTSGGKTLGDLVRAERKASGQFVDHSFTLNRLFDLKSGVFPPLTGATSTEWTGGSHYYFWIGALGEATLGSLGTMGGLVAELRAKKGADRGPQGEVEVSHFVCGSIFGAEARKEATGLLAVDPAHPGACGDAPSPGEELVLVGSEYEVLSVSDTKALWACQGRREAEDRGLNRVWGGLWAAGARREPEAIGSIFAL